MFKKSLGAFGGVKLTDANIIPSLHVYPGSWNQYKKRGMTTADVDTLASAGRSLVIGEFGGTGTGKTDWKGVVRYAKSKGYTVLAWAWNGDGNPSSNMVCFCVSLPRRKPC